MPRTSIRLFFASAFAMGAFAAGASCATADPVPALNAPYPVQNQQDERYGETRAQPYAMNYTDEAAQSLGVRDGRWEAFSTASSPNSLMPSVHGGIDSGGAMLTLQWHPGQ